MSDSAHRSAVDRGDLVAAASRFDRIAVPAAVAPANVRARAIAFYESGFSSCPDIDGRLDGACQDWTLLAASRQGPGIPAPRLPGELGWYAPAHPGTLARQAALARLHGVQAFCVRVRVRQGRLSGEAAFAAFVEADSEGIDVCLSWVCDGADAQASVDDDAEVFFALARRHLAADRYVRIDGRPLIVIEHPERIAEPAALCARWRQACREAGIATPLLVAMNPEGDPRASGFDAALELPLPTDTDPSRDIDAGRLAEAAAHDPAFRGQLVDYRAFALQAAERPWPEHPAFRGVVPGWNDLPRAPATACVCRHDTPDAYRAWLEAAVAFAEARPVHGERCVFVQGWNAWLDGAALEPDADSGHARLHATRNALACAPVRPKLALISHDAQPHGAQYLALNLLREFVRLGVEVEILMQGPGWLEAEFETLAPIHRLYAMEAAALSTLAEGLRARGVAAVIANTTVCGRIIAPFRAAGLRVIALIHELPGVIARYGLQQALVDLLAASDHVVVSSRAVRDGVLAGVADAAIARRLVMRPQGLFARNRHRGGRDASEPRVRLRDRIGLPHHVAVAVAVGYADARKGVDLLARAAIRACARRSDLNVVWVGHRDPQLCADVDALLREAGIADRFHFVGLDFDTDDYYAGADVYALASREDPFPSVVLESLAVGTPVVAFAGTGGGADLVERGTGFTVPAFDVDAYADALLRIVNDPPLRERLGARGRALIDREFDFRRYALDLLALAGDDTPRISAVVPNYDYARYLPERIDSIAAQRLPVAEIVVLDDASTDNSLELLRLQSLCTHPAPVVIAGGDNSGSVFRQWLEGVRRATGEFVWIAEADDLAEPELTATLAAAMRADTGIVMACAQSCRIDAFGHTLAPDYLGYTDDLSPARWRGAYTASGIEEVDAGLAVKNTLPNVSAVLFRRDALLAVLERHIDELAGYRIAGDWVVYLRLLRLGRFHFEPTVLNRHRFHPASVSGGLDPRRHWEEVIAVQALAQRLYPVAETTRIAAAEYAARLHAHFGLAEVA